MLGIFIGITVTGWGLCILIGSIIAVLSKKS